MLIAELWIEGGLLGSLCLKRLSERFPVTWMHAMSVLQDLRGGNVAESVLMYGKAIHVWIASVVILRSVSLLARMLPQEWVY